MKKKRFYMILAIIGVMVFIAYKLFQYYASPLYRQPYQMNQRSDDTLRIAYIGDSWAYLHKYHKCNIPQLLEDTLHRPVRVCSYGISGLMSKEIYENMYDNSDFRRFLTENRYDYCYISAGINDTYRKMSVSYYQKSMNNIIRLLLENHVRPIIQEIPDYDISISYDWQDRTIKLHRRLSMLLNSTPLDCKQMFRDALDDMISKNDYQNKVDILRYKSWNDDYIHDLTHLYLVDRLHLNEKGYAKLDSAIAAVIVSSVAKE
ncbi:MAG: SGNH/GDSL hydrolase family protein [Aeriscardovia sp.]|nr:SGNH/GDSL hydrolase family protein [Aeriscardovia sp.]